MAEKTAARTTDLPGNAFGSATLLGRPTRLNAALFAGLVSLFCLWALSLPLFPTQDGPMHKYYVHAMASLLSGSHAYDAYAIRHPFPPYATHYALLLGLTKVVSFDLAERLLICMVFVLTAYGVRYCARSLGPGGDSVSLCAVPLVLHWSVGMGFLNYSIAVGLFFFCAGLWCRASGRAWWWFALTTLLLAFTHPIPLLILIVFCGVDLLLVLLQRGRGLRLALGEARWQLCGLAFAGLCLLYSLASVDRSRSASNLRGFGLHRDALISSVALFGLSPFDTRSKNAFVDLYRLGLYALLFGCLALAAQGVVSRLRGRQLRHSDSMLLLSAAILLAIPILPASMNGSDFFAQRLMLFPWLMAIAAAGGFAYPLKLGRAVPVFAVGLTLTALIPAETLFRPVAHELVALEQQSLPEHTQGLALLDPAMLKAVRVQHQLGFNPYLWSGVLPFLHANDVMLNSPFMDQKITPLMPVAGGDLLIDHMHSPQEAEERINGNVNLPQLPSSLLKPLLAANRFFVFVGEAPALQSGLVPLIGENEAARYACTSHEFYLVCAVRR